MKLHIGSLNCEIHQEKKRQDIALQIKSVVKWLITSVLLLKPLRRTRHKIKILQKHP